MSPNDFIASIKAFADWWKLHHSTLTSGCEGSKFRLKLKKLKVENDLPNGNATNAYLNPDDEHMVRFLWPVYHMTEFCVGLLLYFYTRV